MFTIWGIAGQSNTYTPGSIRAQRRIEKMVPSPPVSSVKEHTFELDTEEPVHHESRMAFSPYAQHDQTPDRVPAILARQIMTSPVTAIGPEVTVKEAWELFQRRRFRHVPVLNREGIIIGLLSDRDVLRQVADSRQSSCEDGTNPLSLFIKDVMTKQVLTAHPETEIRSVARVMFTERIGAMPIVDREGLLAGIITRSDILRTVMQQVPFELWI